MVNVGKYTSPMDGIGTKTYKNIHDFQFLSISNHESGNLCDPRGSDFLLVSTGSETCDLGDDQGLHRPTGWQHRQVPKNHPELRMNTKWIRQDESILLELSLPWSIQQILKHSHQSATFNANVRPIFFSYALPEFCDYKEFTTKTEIILHPMPFHRVKVRNYHPWPHVIGSKISWSLGSLGFF